MIILFYCLASIYAVPNLDSAQKSLEYFFHQCVSALFTCLFPLNAVFVSHTSSVDPIKVKQRQKTALFNLMCLSYLSTALRRCAIDNGEEIKDNAELLQIAEETNSSFLMHHVYIGQMYLKCYFWNYSSVVDFGEKY
jgi:hypothetical protein